VSRFQFVEDNHGAYGVKRLCHVLGISRSGFYRWREASPVRAERERADQELGERIRQIHVDSDGAYGRPRITAELRDTGVAVNHKRVGRIMRRVGIGGLHLRKKVRTTIPEPAASPVPDLLERDFTAQAPNTRYVRDITYLPVGDGKFLYLATVIDLFSRRLAGWSIAEHMRTDLVTDALRAAAATRGGDLQGAIFHSDNGAQGSRQFAELCDSLGVIRSRGAVGTSADNAAAKAFNASLKRETLQGAKRWPGARAARLAVFRWATRYNTRRRHSALGNRSPVDYEHRSATLAIAA
jgi:transposase InsO family protein